MTIGAAQQFFLGASKATGGGAAGYQIERSLRFSSNDSAYLSRTPAVAGDRKKWTWAAWAKRSSTVNSKLFYIQTGSAQGGIEWTNTAQIGYFNAPTNYSIVKTTGVFRDFSAWYHIVVVLDAANTSLKIYVNGVEQALTVAAPIINENHNINTTVEHNIGKEPTASEYFNGYLADIHFIDGQALTPSSFTEVSATTGQLIPKAYAGTYGLVSVAAATGALPIFNTTGTYGAVQGSGTRTDSNSASLVLALPLVTNANDVSNAINSASTTKTTSPSGAVASSAQSIFYGGSFLFNGSGDYIAVTDNADFAFGTGNSTVEMWVYPNTLVSNDVLYDGRQSTGGTATGFSIVVNSSGIVQTYTAGGYRCTSTSTLSVGKWSHIAVVRSSGTDTLFIDGIAQADTDTLGGNYTDQKCRIGSDVNGSEAWGGYIADFRLYKGVAKYTSNFSPVVSYNNSFHLDFADNSSNTAATLGKDTSGNSNNWTPNNLSVTAGAGNDSLVDTPTSYGTDTGAGGEVRGNYATLNPLDTLSGATLSNGNLDLATPTGGYGTSRGTIAVSSGKFYWEILINSVSPDTANADPIIGIWSASKTLTANWTGGTADSYGYQAATGNKVNNAIFTSYGVSFTVGDIISVALNLDAGTLVFYKNGSSQGTAFSSLSGTFVASAGDSGGSGSCSLTANFGQRPFAYTAPSGFKALCDTNLPAPLVALPNTVFDVVTYTGTGAALTPTSSLGFNPDWIWIKSRSAATDHALYDVVRGTQARVESNNNGAEVTSDGGVTAFNSAGFTLGTLAQVNTNSATYVAWCWDAGTSTVPNTTGSIASQVRANVSAGFSVVTYTGTGVLGTVGHGLGAVPDLIIVKRRDFLGSFYTYHSSIGNTGALGLDLTNATIVSSNFWNNTSPTSSVLTINNASTELNANGGTYVLYVFSRVVGYSSFGSYTGNGSADGPFVYTGFRPRWVLFKNTNSGENWRIMDAARNTYNVANFILYPNLSNAEGSSAVGFDILSNGFKIREIGSELNASGATIIYAAFAENPFQYARAC